MASLSIDQLRIVGRCVYYAGVYQQSWCLPIEAKSIKNLTDKKKQPESLFVSSASRNENQFNIKIWNSGAYLAQLQCTTGHCATTLPSLQSTFIRSRNHHSPEWPLASPSSPITISSHTLLYRTFGFPTKHIPDTCYWYYHRRLP